MLKLHVMMLTTAMFLALRAGADEGTPKPTEASDEHAFLEQFVGEWECEGEAFMAAGQPPVKITSSMSGHMIGRLWAVIVIKMDGAQPYHGQGTFGYDSRNKKYIGTWTDSVSDFMWRYEGAVTGNKFVYHSQGPSPTDPTKMIKARDTWVFKDKDTILLTGEMEGPDGKMTTMMTSVCRRKK